MSSDAPHPTPTTRWVQMSEEDRDALDRFTRGDPMPLACRARCSALVAAFDVAADPPPMSPECADRGCRHAAIDRLVNEQRPVLDRLAVDDPPHTGETLRADLETLLDPGVTGDPYTGLSLYMAADRLDAVKAAVARDDDRRVAAGPPHHHAALEEAASVVATMLETTRPVTSTAAANAAATLRTGLALRAALAEPPPAETGCSCPPEGVARGLHRATCAPASPATTPTEEEA